MVGLLHALFVRIAELLENDKQAKSLKERIKQLEQQLLKQRNDFELYKAQIWEATNKIQK